MHNVAGTICYPDQHLKYKLEKGTITITSCDPKPTGALIIPDTIDGFPVTSIGYGAFWGCSGLTSVTIPNSVTSMSDYAFPNHTVITKT